MQECLSDVWACCFYCLEKLHDDSIDCRTFLRTGVKQMEISFNFQLVGVVSWFGQDTANVPVKSTFAKPFGSFFSVLHLGKLHSPVQYNEHSVILEVVDCKGFTVVLVVCARDVCLPLEHHLLSMVCIVQCIFKLVVVGKN